MEQNQITFSYFYSFSMFICSRRVKVGSIFGDSSVNCKSQENKKTANQIVISPGILLHQIRYILQYICFLIAGKNGKFDSYTVILIQYISNMNFQQLVCIQVLFVFLIFSFFVWLISLWYFRFFIYWSLKLHDFLYDVFHLFIFLACLALQDKQKIT